MKYEVMDPKNIPQSWYGQITGLDIETEDLSINSRICMVSIFNPYENKGGVIPIYWFSGDSAYSISSGDLDILKGYLSSIKAVGHNLHFDIPNIYYNWGIKIQPYFDTFIMARVFQFKEQSLKGIILRIKPEWSDEVLRFSDLDSKEPPFRYTLDSRTVK